VTLVAILLLTTIFNGGAVSVPVHLMDADECIEEARFNNEHQTGFKEVTTDGMPVIAQSWGCMTESSLEAVLSLPAR
jgi:hypothetical protein